jgi:hypothetical protein
MDVMHVCPPSVFPIAWSKTVEEQTAMEAGPHILKNESGYLLSPQARGRWMRHDTAYLLKRFFFCERALLVCAGAWLPILPALTTKIGLAQIIWEGSRTADALRERVFELRYPSRLLAEEGADHALVSVFQNLRHAPSVPAFLGALGQVLLPALLEAYTWYLDISDPIADAPTRRFLNLAHSEKKRQIASIEQWLAEAILANQAIVPSDQDWVQGLSDWLKSLGGVAVNEAAESSSRPQWVPGSRQYLLPSKPARDPRFWPCRFYWPDNLDRSFPYGEGLTLQLRSAVSHLNEVWAVETGGVILSFFADALPWEWLRDAARWTYDEARHCYMGYDRLLGWGFAPAELPLGTYIYESVAEEDPIYRLGMLFFFETKNIGKKQDRARAFSSYGDSVSQHDMDFDWADETMHAGYGKYWLKQILALGDRPGLSLESVKNRCSELVEAFVQTASPEEREALILHTHNLVAKVSCGSAEPLG